MKTLSIFSIFFALLSLTNLNARVYENVRVGQYSAVIDLNEYKGQPFFEVMRDVIYPVINEEAANRSPGWGGHLKSIKRGEGVEVVLTDDVTTYHVKYAADWEDKVERSGRSFGALGEGRLKQYIADASYKHYLRTLEAALKDGDQTVRDFYSAILLIITNSDPSGINKLNSEAKQVASDFVAIYIAEQYRRLTATKGQYLGRSHRWDDALTQVTFLAAFHSGQDKMELFYEGEFTDRVYHQDACLYKARGQEEKRANTRKRRARLYDYWQFTVRSECPGRSGVNLTRRDFEKLGRALTKHLNSSHESLATELDLHSGYGRNFVKALTGELLEGSFEYESVGFVEHIVEVLMTLRADANLISSDL